MYTIKMTAMAQIIIKRQIKTGNIPCKLQLLCARKAEILYFYHPRRLWWNVILPLFTLKELFESLSLSSKSLVCINDRSKKKPKTKHIGTNATEGNKAPVINKERKHLQ